jgi:hypothetical protein
MGRGRYQKLSERAAFGGGLASTSTRTALTEPDAFVYAAPSTGPSTTARLFRAAICRAPERWISRMADTGIQT